MMDEVAGIEDQVEERRAEVPPHHRVERHRRSRRCRWSRTTRRRRRNTALASARHSPGVGRELGFGILCHPADAARQAAPIADGRGHRIARLDHLARGAVETGQAGCPTTTWCGRSAAAGPVASGRRLELGHARPDGVADQALDGLGRRHRTELELGDLLDLVDGAQAGDACISRALALTTRPSFADDPAQRVGDVGRGLEPAVRLAWPRGARNTSSPARRPGDRRQCRRGAAPPPAPGSCCDPAPSGRRADRAAPRLRSDGIFGARRGSPARPEGGLVPGAMISSASSKARIEAGEPGEVGRVLAVGIDHQRHRGPPARRARPSRSKPLAI
jgi:hypothetical protein